MDTKPYNIKNKNQEKQKCFDSFCFKILKEEIQDKNTGDSNCFKHRNLRYIQSTGGKQKLQKYNLKKH